MAQIKNWETGEIIFEVKGKNLKKTVELAIKKGYDLSFANLMGVDLRGADLRGARLNKTNLNWADLKGAIIIKAMLKDVHLEFANLENARLDGSDLSNTKLNNSVLSSAFLQSAILKNAELNGAILTDANLSEANLSEVTAQEANLSGAILRDANLSKVYLTDANLQDADLSYADLSNANLYNADLIGVDLGNANLVNADLTGVDFDHANLRYADLSKAYMKDSVLNNVILTNTKLCDTNMNDVGLYNAILSYADLTDANLSNAKLRSTFLVSTKVKNTNFLNCKVDLVVFGQMALGEALNLDKIIAGGESVIDFQTLRDSPKLSKTFLQKIGLPDIYIDYLPNFYDDKPLNLHSVFLSHSSKNKKFARRLYNTLIKMKVRVWFDEKKFLPGDRIYETISYSIDVYDKMILVCSEASLNSLWVSRELSKSRKKEEKLFKKTGKKLDVLIPIMIDDYLFEWENDNQDYITERVVGDFRNWQDPVAFEKNLDKLIQALNADRKEDDPLSLF